MISSLFDSFAHRFGLNFIFLAALIVVVQSAVLDCDEEITWRDQVREGQLAIQSQQSQPSGSNGNKIVQFGNERTPATLFDMKYQPDKAGSMLRKFGQGKTMHDTWPAVKELKFRQFNFRLYETPASGSNILFGGYNMPKGMKRTSSVGTGNGDTVKMVCMATNNYEKGDDKLGNYAFDTTITSTSGKKIRFMQCDDDSECRSISVARRVLTASNRATPKHSDGWCVGPIDEETGVKVELTGVKKMLGLNFLHSDSTVSDFVFVKEKKLLRRNGKLTSTSFDTHGLFSGDLPEILIMPGGIEDGKADMPTAGIQSSHLSNQLVSKTRMVQFGPTQNSGTYFDMKYMDDKDGNLVKMFGAGVSAHDKWTNVEALKFRHFNFRLYKTPAVGSDILFKGLEHSPKRRSPIGIGSEKTVKMVCMVTNNYKTGDDKKGKYAFDTKITSTSGKDIRFLQCDDISECHDLNSHGTVLRAFHKATPNHSDGWCVGPVDDVTGVKVEITNVKKMVGVNFLDSDSSVGDFIFSTQKKLLRQPGNSVEEGGLFSGNLPAIIIRPGGIEKISEGESEDEEEEGNELSVQSSSKSKSEEEYKMVQFGPKQSDATLFNARYSADRRGELLSMYGAGISAHDRWPGIASLKFREFNVRLMETPAEGSDVLFGSLEKPKNEQSVAPVSKGGDEEFVKMVCIITNNYKTGDDKLGNYAFNSEITSTGKAIRFMQCDDAKPGKSECLNRDKASKKLTARHVATPRHSDGWCVGPIDKETGVKIKITGVKNMVGINFLSSDSSVGDFIFKKHKSIFQSLGTVDRNGLYSGDLPEIYINPGGILKSY